MRTFSRFLVLMLLCASLAPWARAAALGGDAIDVLALLSVVLIGAKLAGGVAQKFGVPSVLAELVFGIILGNLGLLSPELSFAEIRDSGLVRGLSEMGVLLLLFLVGLETDIKALGKMGKSSSAVAVVGVIVPVLLTFVMLPLFRDFDFNKLLFFGSTLTATSVGISVRVLQEAGRMKTPTGQVILGAAVIDDILGILILTVVSAIVTRGTFDPADLVLLLGKVALFTLGVVILRKYVFTHAFRRIRPLEVSGTVTVFAVSLCMILAWVAQSVGLAGILGAFALGIAMDDVHFSGYRETTSYTLEHLMKPLTDFLVPIFFIIMGMSVELMAFSESSTLFLAGILTLCAAAGKIACALATRAPGVDRLLVGFGMLPRGEVGIIFAVIGLRLGIFDKADYSAVIVMVALTTLLAPFLMASRMSASGSRKHAQTV